MARRVAEVPIVGQCVERIVQRVVRRRVGARARAFDVLNGSDDRARDSLLLGEHLEGVRSGAAQARSRHRVVAVGVAAEAGRVLVPQLVKDLVFHDVEAVHQEERLRRVERHHFVRRPAARARPSELGVVVSVRVTRGETGIGEVDAVGGEHDGLANQKVVGLHRVVIARIAVPDVAVGETELPQLAAQLIHVRQRRAVVLERGRRRGWRRKRRRCRRIRFRN